MSAAGDQGGAMQYRELFKRAKMRSFKPFRLHLSDGTVYEVKHADLVVVGRRTAVIGVQERAGTPEAVADTFASVDLIHVTQLTEFGRPKSAS